MKEFDYRLPPSIRSIGVVIALILFLGTHGYLDGSFPDDAGARPIGSVVFRAVPLLLGTTPCRDSRIRIDERGISVPNLLIPPYRLRTCSWQEIQACRSCTGNTGSRHWCCIPRAAG